VRGALNGEAGAEADEVAHITVGDIPVWARQQAVARAIPHEDLAGIGIGCVDAEERRGVIALYLERGREAEVFARADADSVRCSRKL